MAPKKKGKGKVKAKAAAPQAPKPDIPVIEDAIFLLQTQAAPDASAPGPLIEPAAAPQAAAEASPEAPAVAPSTARRIAEAKEVKEHPWKKIRCPEGEMPKMEYEDATEEGNTKMASLYNLAFMGSDSDVDSDETMFNRNRSGFSDRALEHFTKGSSTIGYTGLGTRVERVLNDSALHKLLEKDQGKSTDAWRTVVDFANQKEIKLSMEDVETIRRISTGQFPGISTDPYDASTSVVDFEYATPDIPLNDTISRARFQTQRKYRDVKIDRMARSMALGTWVSPEQRLKRKQEQVEQDLDTRFDVWDTEMWTKRRLLPIVPAPKEALPDHGDSYRPPEEFLKENEDLIDALRKVTNYKALVDERMNRLLDLSSCERSYKMTLNVDRQSLLPPLPPLKTLRPFPTDLKLQMRGMTMWRLKGEDGDNTAHYARMIARGADPKRKADCTAINVSKCGNFIAIGDSQGVVSVVHFLHPTIPGVVVWRDTLHVADDAKDGLSTPIRCLRFHPTEPILAVMKGHVVVYVVLPEMRAEVPRRLNFTAKELSLMDEKTIIDHYFTLYEGSKCRAALTRLGLSPDGGPAMLEQDLAERQRAMVRFSITLSRHQKEAEELDEMAEEELEMVEKAGIPVDLINKEGEVRNEMYLRSRPGLSVIARHKKGRPTSGNWNAKGTYFATVSVATGGNSAKHSCLVHAPSRWAVLSIMRKQLPNCHSVAFHPNTKGDAPILFVGHFKGIDALNLQGGPNQDQIVPFKRFKGAENAVSMDMHPRGTVLMMGNTREQMLLYDLEGGSKKHVQRLDMDAGAIRSVAFHPTRPIGAAVVKKTALDGTSTSHVHIVHVSAPEFATAFAIPVKILDFTGKGEGLGPLTTCQWHPREPWLLTGHGDGSVCMWT